VAVNAVKRRRNIFNSMAIKTIDFNDVCSGRKRFQLAVCPLCEIFSRQQFLFGRKKNTKKIVVCIFWSARGKYDTYTAFKNRTQNNLCFKICSRVLSFSSFYSCS